MASTNLYTPIRFTYNKTLIPQPAILATDVQGVMYDVTIASGTLNAKLSDGLGGFTTISFAGGGGGGGGGGTTVTANPGGTGLTALTTITIGATDYSIPTGLGRGTELPSNAEINDEFILTEVYSTPSSYPLGDSDWIVNNIPTSIMYAGPSAIALKGSNLYTVGFENSNDYAIFQSSELDLSLATWQRVGQPHQFTSNINSLFIYDNKYFIVDPTNRPGIAISNDLTPSGNSDWTRYEVHTNNLQNSRGVYVENNKIYLGDRVRLLIYVSNNLAPSGNSDWTTLSVHSSITEIRNLSGYNGRLFVVDQNNNVWVSNNLTPANDSHWSQLFSLHSSHSANFNASLAIDNDYIFSGDNTLSGTDRPIYRASYIPSTRIFQPRKYRFTLSGWVYSSPWESGTTVTANPGGTGLTALTTITIGATDYSIPQDGGGASFTPSQSNLYSAVKAILIPGSNTTLTESDTDNTIAVNSPSETITTDNSLDTNPLRIKYTNSEADLSKRVLIPVQEHTDGSESFVTLTTNSQGIYSRLAPTAGSITPALSAINRIEVSDSRNGEITLYVNASSVPTSHNWVKLHLGGRVINLPFNSIDSNLGYRYESFAIGNVSILINNTVSNIRFEFANNIYFPPRVPESNLSKVVSVNSLDTHFSQNIQNKADKDLGNVDSDLTDSEKTGFKNKLDIISLTTQEQNNIHQLANEYIKTSQLKNTRERTWVQATAAEGQLRVLGAVPTAAQVITLNFSRTHTYGLLSRDDIVVLKIPLSNEITNYRVKDVLNSNSNEHYTYGSHFTKITDDSTHSYYYSQINPFSNSVLSIDYDELLTEFLGKTFATEAEVDTSDFGNNLTTDADTVQKALDEIDDLSLGGGSGGGGGTTPAPTVLFTTTTAIGTGWVEVTLTEDLPLKDHLIDFRLAHIDSGAGGYAITTAEVLATTTATSSAPASYVGALPLKIMALDNLGFGHDTILIQKSDEANKLWVRTGRSISAAWTIRSYQRGGSGGTSVVANPGGTGLTTLSTITIGDTDYSVPQDSGGASFTPSQSNLYSAVKAILIPGSNTTLTESDTDNTIAVNSPSETTVIANPGGTGLTTLSTITIGDTSYSVPQGGGASFTPSQSNLYSAVKAILIPGSNTTLTESDTDNTIAVNSPSETTVIANPGGTGLTTLSTITIGDTDYSVPQDSGGASFTPSQSNLYSAVKAILIPGSNTTLTESDTDNTIAVNSPSGTIPAPTVLFTTTTVIGTGWVEVTLTEDLPLKDHLIDFRLAHIDSGAGGYAITTAEVLATTTATSSAPASYVGALPLKIMALNNVGFGHDTILIQKSDEANKLWVRTGRDVSAAWTIRSYQRGGSGGSNVVANPGGSGLTALSSITIGDTSYSVPQGGGGGVSVGGNNSLNSIDLGESPQLTLPGSGNWVATGITVPENTHWIVADLGLGHDTFEWMFWDFVANLTPSSADTNPPTGTYETVILESTSNRIIRIGRTASNEILLAIASGQSLTVPSVSWKIPTADGGTSVVANPTTEGGREDATLTVGTANNGSMGIERRNSGFLSPYGSVSNPAFANQGYISTFSSSDGTNFFVVMATSDWDYPQKISVGDNEINVPAGLNLITGISIVDSVSTAWTTIAIPTSSFPDITSWSTHFGLVDNATLDFNIQRSDDTWLFSTEAGDVPATEELKRLEVGDTVYSVPNDDPADLSPRRVSTFPHHDNKVGQRIYLTEDYDPRGTINFTIGDGTSADGYSKADDAGFITQDIGSLDIDGIEELGITASNSAAYIGSTSEIGANSIIHKATHIVVDHLEYLLGPAVISETPSILFKRIVDSNDDQLINERSPFYNYSTGDVYRIGLRLNDGNHVGLHFDNPISDYRWTGAEWSILRVLTDGLWETLNQVAVRRRKNLDNVSVRANSVNIGFEFNSGTFPEPPAGWPSNLNGLIYGRTANQTDSIRHYFYFDAREPSGESHRNYIGKKLLWEGHEFTIEYQSRNSSRGRNLYRASTTYTGNINHSSWDGLNLEDVSEEEVDHLSGRAWIFSYDERGVAPNITTTEAEEGTSIVTDLNFIWDDPADKETTYSATEPHTSGTGVLAYISNINVDSYSVPQNQPKPASWLMSPSFSDTTIHDWYMTAIFASADTPVFTFASNDNAEWNAEWEDFHADLRDNIVIVMRDSAEAVRHFFLSEATRTAEGQYTFPADTSRYFTGADVDVAIIDSSNTNIVLTEGEQAEVSARKGYIHNNTRNRLERFTVNARGRITLEGVNTAVGTPFEGKGILRTSATRGYYLNNFSDATRFRRFTVSSSGDITFDSSGHITYDRRVESGFLTSPTTGYFIYQFSNDSYHLRHFSVSSSGTISINSTGVISLGTDIYRDGFLTSATTGYLLNDTDNKLEHFTVNSSGVLTRTGSGDVDMTSNSRYAFVVSSKIAYLVEDDSTSVILRKYDIASNGTVSRDTTGDYTLYHGTNSYGDATITDEFDPGGFLVT